ncbi:hypothetical protein XELAEV_18033490mg [Xenopus laevis]|uniref:Uncharacterized protein n=1 Tax=Xenopus laevis TaxID=8355 RepID=A0A974HE17_XENLA|nr:hypothetical protein XELAEV_18033490mg [Xenopus laevis]
MDDLLILWNGDTESLNKFQEEINNIEKSLKFTCTWRTETLNFLDVNFHPTSLKKSLPSTQYTRVKLIGYPNKVLEEGLVKIKNVDRTGLLDSNNKVKKEGDRMVFVSKYTMASGQVSKIIKKYWHLLQNCLPHIPQSQQTPFMAYQRGRYIRIQLDKADIGSQKRKTKDFYNIRNMCPCGLIYIGETNQKICDQISKHKLTIRKKITTLPVPYHFHQAKHSVSQLKFQVIETVNVPRRDGNRWLQWKYQEMYWIHKLDTIWPRGLNRKYTPGMFIFK